MDDTAKYLIHAAVSAEGVVERSDVVGAIFGQTEGLLGDDLDLRDLRHSGKVGRIDVSITSAGGSASGHLTIATSLDKVETATLAASLETIDRVGPCRAQLEISEIEDVRAAKRKAVVDRATELLRSGFDDSVMSSEEILAEVRQHVRVEDITEYEGLPAGPRVTDGDAIIVVEGRSDVVTLLKYGIKNAIGVEGTNVPDAVAELTRHRTVTAFLDGDRGGDLILEELTQVGEIDYVAFAPAGSSVEDLAHHQAFAALRNKVPYEAVAEENEPRDVIAATDGSASPAPPPSPSRPDSPDTTEVGRERSDGTAEHSGAPSSGEGREDDATGLATAEGPAGSEPATVYEHADDVVRSGSETVRLLDAAGEAIGEAAVADVYDALDGVEETPETILLDGILDQQLLDLAADRGVARVVARSLGQFTKRPTGVRIHAIDDVAEDVPDTS